MRAPMDGTPPLPERHRRLDEMDHLAGRTHQRPQELSPLFTESESTTSRADSSDAQMASMLNIRAVSAAYAVSCASVSSALQPRSVAMVGAMRAAAPRP